MTTAVQAPAELLDGQPDFPYEPVFREWEGLRLAHVDVGDGPPVVMWHGEPTWSFLWRKVLPQVVEAGYRVICPDLPGFGRSDKPVDIGWYTYDRMTAAAGSLLADLELDDATFVVHDWGGPIGLRVAAEHPERVDRLVMMDTGIFTGEQQMSDMWNGFREFVATTEDLPVGMLVRGGCASDPGEAVGAAYDAPFTSVASKAGARALPQLIPLSPEAPGAAAGRRVLHALRSDPRPSLLLWADSDPVLPLEVGETFASQLEVAPPRLVSGAGHFLQEDRGEEIGALIADWLRVPATRLTEVKT